MLELTTKRILELSQAKNEVIQEVTSKLFERQKHGQSSFKQAISESIVVLDKNQFNNHIPSDQGLWTVISCAIGRKVDFECERLFLLAHLFPSLMQVVATDYQLAVFTQLFEFEPA